MAQSKPRHCGWRKIRALTHQLPTRWRPARPVWRRAGLLRADLCHNSMGPARVFGQARRNAAGAPWNHPGSIIPPPNCLTTISHDRVGTRIAIKRVCFSSAAVGGCQTLRICSAIVCVAWRLDPPLGGSYGGTAAAQSAISGGMRIGRGFAARSNFPTIRSQ